MSLAIAWLVNRVFAAGTIHAIFGTDHFPARLIGDKAYDSGPLDQGRQKAS